MCSRDQIHGFVIKTCLPLALVLLLHAGCGHQESNPSPAPSSDTSTRSDQFELDAVHAIEAYISDNARPVDPETAPGQMLLYLIDQIDNADDSSQELEVQLPDAQEYALLFGGNWVTADDFAAISTVSRSSAKRLVRVADEYAFSAQLVASYSSDGSRVQITDMPSNVVLGAPVVKLAPGTVVILSRREAGGGQWDIHSKE